MALIDRILVPIDGTAASRAAYRLALDLAAAYRAEVVLLYVVDAPAVEEHCRLSGLDRSRLLEEIRECGAKLLASLSREAQEQQLRVVVDILAGLPDEIILQEAERHGAHLIVMGKIGHPGHRRGLLGSVTERVLEASDLPVLVVSSAGRSRG